MTNYVILVPIFGSVGTRNPITKYFGFGQLYDDIKDASISSDKEYLERLLKIKRKESDIYKKAFVALIN